MPDGLPNTPNPDRDLTNALSYTIAYDVSIHHFTVLLANVVCAVQKLAPAPME